MWSLNCYPFKSVGRCFNLARVSVGFTVVIAWSLGDIIANHKGGSKSFQFSTYLWPLLSANQQKRCSTGAVRATPPPPSLSNLWTWLSQIQIPHLKQPEDKQLVGNQKGSGWTKGKAIYYFLQAEECRAIENARGAQWWTEPTSEIGLERLERKP